MWTVLPRLEASWVRVHDLKTQFPGFPFENKLVLCDGDIGRAQPWRRAFTRKRLSKEDKKRLWTDQS